MIKPSNPLPRVIRYRSRLRPAEISAPAVYSGKTANELRWQSKLVSRRKSERDAVTLIEGTFAAEET
jgi:hypothetical protein